MFPMRRPPFDPNLGQPHKLPPTPTQRQMQMQAAHRGRGRGPGGWQGGGSVGRNMFNPRAAAAAAMIRNAPPPRPIREGVHVPWTGFVEPGSWPVPPGGWQLGGAVGGFDMPAPPPPGGNGDIWPEGCPSPKEHIQLANNDWILAGELKVGDEVMTSEEPQKVTRVQRLENRPRCEVLFEDSDSIVTSYSHPYFVNSKGFVEVGDLEKGDIIGDLVVKDKKPFAMGPVISLSVDKAETYMLQGGTKENPVPALSHNKTPVEPTIPQWILDQWAAQQAAREEARRKAAAAAARAKAAAARRANQAQRQASRGPGGWYAGGDVDVDSREALMAEREMLQQQLQMADEVTAQEIMAQIMEINKELEMAAAPGMAGGGIASLRGGGRTMNPRAVAAAAARRNRPQRRLSDVFPRPWYTTPPGGG